MESLVTTRRISLLNDPILVEEIICNRNKLGYIAYKQKDDVVWFTVQFKQKCTKTIYTDCLDYILHKLILKYHPVRFVCDQTNTYFDEILTNRQFVLSKNLYVYKVDSLRYQIRDAAFDEKEYIIHQGLLKDIPFGWFNSEYNGCGWIATYNFCRINGKQHDMQKIIHSLEKYTLLKEAFGANIFRIYHYLRRNDIQCNIYSGSSSQIKKKIERSSAGILLYTHSRGAHYVAYRRIGNRTFQFYNAVYGKRRDISTIDEFYNKHISLPVQCVIVQK